MLDLGYFNFSAEKKIDLISILGEVENNQNDVYQNISFQELDNIWTFHWILNPLKALTYVTVWESQVII